MVSLYLFIQKVVVMELRQFVCQLGDFYLGSRDEQIGKILDVPYYMHTSNSSYWQHLQIVIDVIDGIGNSFSLESAKDKSFIIRAKKLDIQ